MANTVQTQTVKTILSVDLSTVTADRLIELCILYRSVPDADKTYPDRLITELKRRYDAAAINNDATTYAVLQHFSNQFGGVSGEFTRKMEEIAASADKEAAFKQNEQWFKEQIEDADNMNWIASSDTAMAAVAASSTAMTAIASSSTARDALIAHNDVLQSVRDVMYQTVKSNWRRYKVYKTSANRQVNIAANAVKSPAGLVFAVLGCHSSRYSAEAILKHPDDTEAARNNRYLGDNFSDMDGNIDGVSFNGATFDETAHYARVYVELWAPN